MAAEAWELPVWQNGDEQSGNILYQKHRWHKYIVTQKDSSMYYLLLILLLGLPFDSRVSVLYDEMEKALKHPRIGSKPQVQNMFMTEDCC